MSIEYKKIILILSILIVVTMVCINSLDRKVILNKSEEKIDENIFAIMVEKEDGSGYEEVDKFPENHIFNEELSNCIDNNGNIINDLITYNNGFINLVTKNTVYCYLYFDYNEPPTITSVTKTSDEQTSITVSVVASSDTTTYYYKIDSNDYVSSTSSTHTFTGLTKGTTYSISVYVVDDNGAKSSVGTYTFETKSITTMSEQLLSNPTSGLNTTLEGGLYRYQGASVDNYVCFGTSDKDTCLNNTDAYMYRIIGIDSSNQVKLIKKEALNTGIKWYSNITSDIPWPNSTIYSNINGSSFYTNTSYVPTSWKSKIATTIWKYGNVMDAANTTADKLYELENAFTGKVSDEIGLIYGHDYYYACQSGGLNCSSSSTSGNIATCKKSWMHLSNNDTGAPSTNEWIMVRWGYSSAVSGYRMRIVYNSGALFAENQNVSLSVRPVFFLKSTVLFEGGTGKVDDPFIIS